MQTEKNLDSAARRRLAALFDDGAYTEVGSLSMEKESLASVITAYGYVNGSLVYAFSQDNTVNSGAVGTVHAQKIAKLYSLAAKTGRPVVGIHDSNGAFIDGTVDSLNAYGEMIGTAASVSGVVPQISVIAGVCAGSAAMLACSADFVVMTKDAELYVAPNGKSTAADAAKAGTAAVVCDDDDAAISAAKELLRLIPENNLTAVPVYEYEENSFASGNTLSDTVNNIADADSVTELYEGFGKASYTALATVAGSTAGIVSTNRTKDKLTADDSAKIARFVRTCDAFGIPLITLVDTEGFDGEGEAAGSVRNMTMLAGAYAEATTAKVTVVTGKAYGPAFVALASKGANADFTFAYEDAVISPLNPVTAVEFLWHEKLAGAASVSEKRSELVRKYIAENATAEKAAYRNAVDEIISSAQIRTKLAEALEILSGKRVSRLPKKHNNLPL
ncbi:carboxyl transferase domain-containing protein [Ruminococcus sp. HUN007]|uniref:carboxyl transferase domain-containing protein n=1 Tax=Ruminococcus sp. HUN007 TaxID=1514668 RepID=UPI0005D2863A|nr:carboxyl transferase domain-containing protein [Ruminococcus sp. HUN007]